MRYSLCTILACLFLACQNEVIPSKELKHIPLSSVYEYLPMELFNSGKQAVFVNSENRERKFNLTINERLIETVDYNGNPYSTNLLLINYAEHTDFGIATVRIRAAVLDFENTELSDVIICEHGGSTFERPKNFVFITEKEHQEQLNFEETFEIWDRSFKNVYSNSGLEEAFLANYQQFHFSSTHGIIAMKGGPDDFWVLDRFE